MVCPKGIVHFIKRSVFSFVCFFLGQKSKRFFYQRWYKKKPTLSQIVSCNLLLCRTQNNGFTSLQNKFWKHHDEKSLVFYKEFGVNPKFKKTKFFCHMFFAWLDFKLYSTKRYIWNKLVDEPDCILQPVFTSHSHKFVLHCLLKRNLLNEVSQWNDTDSFTVFEPVETGKEKNFNQFCSYLFCFGWETEFHKFWE